MKHIPNFITSLNLVSGFLAILSAANGNLVTASWLILAAMVFDFCDGFSARLLKAHSPIGKELDSLADVVSFGVAPAMIIYKLIDTSSAPIVLDSTGILSTMVPDIILYVPVLLMPVCAALRLAKFNIDDTQTTSFKGLATPASAIAIISIVIAARYSDSGLVKSFTDSPIFLAIYSIVLSLLMVSRISLFSLKIKNLKIKGNEGRYILIILALISFVLFGIDAAILIIPFYILCSYLSGLFR